MVARAETSPRPLFRDEGDRRVFDHSSDPQRDFLISTAPDILFTGGWGLGGKTIALCVKCCLFGQLYSGVPMVMGRKVRADMATSTMPKLRRVIEEMFGVGTWDRGCRGGVSNPEQFVFDNGSTIDFVGFDRREKLLSTEYGFVGIDECNEIDEDDWEFAAGRLRSWESPFRQIAGACNPDNPNHFLGLKFSPNEGSHKIYGPDHACEDCNGKGEREAWFVDDDLDPGKFWSEKLACETCNGSGHVQDLIAEVVVAGPGDNAENLPREYRARLARLTGVRRLRYALSMWVAYAGIVYDTFDPKVHVLSRDQVPQSWSHWGGYPPPDWPRYRSIDFGFIDPFVCQWWARSPDRRFYLYREIYKTGRTVNQHKLTMKAEEDKERATIAECWIDRERDKYDVWDWAKLEPTLRPPRPRFMATFCDHDAEDRATLAEEPNPFVNTPAIKRKKPGIEKVQELLTPFEVDGQVQSRIYFCRDALVEFDQELNDKKQPTSTIQEMPGYQWLPKAEGKSAKEDTIPDKDHGMDALRYFIDTIEAGDRAIHVPELGVD